MRSEANKNRIINGIQAKGDDFLAALQRHRIGQAQITTDNKNLQAVQNFFDYGYKVCQYVHFRCTAINKMVLDYIHLVPTINQIEDFSIKLVLSKISKEEAYAFANKVRDNLDEVGIAAERYFALRPPIFNTRQFAEVGGSFIPGKVVVVPHDLAQLISHHDKGILHTILCLDPKNFAVILS